MRGEREIQGAARSKEITGGDRLIIYAGKKKGSKESAEGKEGAKVTVEDRFK